MIKDYIKREKGSCKVFPAPFAVFLNADGKNYVEPDISIICDLGKVDERGCNGAPDWVIESVSPSTAKMDYGIKLFKYRSAGVQEYGIVDHAKNQIFVYGFQKDAMKNYAFEDTVRSEIYGGLEINFAEVLALL